MFLWEIPDNYPEGLIGTYDGRASPDRFAFKRGLALPSFEAPPTVRFGCLSAELEGFDDLATNAMVPIVSERVQQALLDYAATDIQLVDVRLLTRDGELSNYRILNVVRSVKAIDHDASSYRLIPGSTSIMGFRKLVLLPGALGAHALARDAEYLSHLLVSDALCGKIRALGLRQVGLYRPEEKTW